MRDFAGLSAGVFSLKNKTKNRAVKVLYNETAARDAGRDPRAPAVLLPPPRGDRGSTFPGGRRRGCAAGPARACSGAPTRSGHTGAEGRSDARAFGDGPFAEAPSAPGAKLLQTAKACAGKACTPDEVARLPRKRVACRDTRRRKPCWPRAKHSRQRDMKRRAKPDSMEFEVGKPVDKPGSVVDSHSSRRTVTGTLKQPTRKRREQRHCFPIRPCSGWGLPCRPRCRVRGELLPRRFTLT